jgi:hypothetical protein
VPALGLTSTVRPVDPGQQADTGLRTCAEQGPAFVGEEEAVACRLSLAKAGVSGERVGAGATKSAAWHDLIDFAGRDLFLEAGNEAGKSAVIEVRNELTPLPGREGLRVSSVALGGSSRRMRAGLRARPAPNPSLGGRGGQRR